MGEKNIVAEVISRIPFNGNQETTQKSTYQNEILSKINDVKELPEGSFTINLKFIQKYQRAEPSIIAKYKMVHTIRVIFVEVVILILSL